MGPDAGQRWNGRGHFFGAAAEAMRRILIENARRKATVRRGGGHRRLPLDDADAIAASQSEDLLTLDEALERLQQRDAQAAELVKLRYFAGLTMAQAAEAMGVSLRTSERNWTDASVWLRAELAEAEDSSPG